MKNLRILSLALISMLFLASCSSDDDGGSTTNEPITGDYFPSTIDNQWIYSVDNTSSTHSELDFTDETDFLKVDTSTGNTYTLKVENNNNDIPYGSMNDMLSVGTLTIGESTLTYSGDLSLPDEFSGFSNQSISLQNVLLYDLNAADNAVMSEVSDTITEDLGLNEDTVPLVIDYILTTSKIGTLNSMTVDGEAYNNVVRTRLNLNVNIYATVPVFGNMSIINEQNVLIIDNYFAEDIGLIKSEAVQGYQMGDEFVALLNSTSTDLGIATSFQMQNIQELSDYLID